MADEGEDDNRLATKGDINRLENRMEKRIITLEHYLERRIDEKIAFYELERTQKITHRDPSLLVKIYMLIVAVVTFLLGLLLGR